MKEKAPDNSTIDFHPSRAKCPFPLTLHHPLDLRIEYSYRQYEHHSKPGHLNIRPSQQSPLPHKQIRSPENQLADFKGVAISPRAAPIRLFELAGASTEKEEGHIAGHVAGMAAMPSGPPRAANLRNASSSILCGDVDHISSQEDVLVGAVAILSIRSVAEGVLMLLARVVDTIIFAKVSFSQQKTPLYFGLFHNLVFLPNVNFEQL